MACEVQVRNPRAPARTPTRPHRAALPPLARYGPALKQRNRGIQRRFLAVGAVDLIELRGDHVFTVLLDEGCEGPGVKLAARYAQAQRQFFGGLENAVRDGDCGLHVCSITQVIPAPAT